MDEPIRYSLLTTEREEYVETNKIMDKFVVLSLLCSNEAVTQFLVFWCDVTVLWDLLWCTPSPIYC